MIPCKYIRPFIYLLLFYCLISCKSNIEHKKEEKQAPKVATLLQIKKQDKLRAVIGYDVTNYFVYNGLIMGFQYEMLQAFAEHLNVKLELTVSDNLATPFQKLDSCKIDVLAMNLVATPQRSSKYNLSIPHSTSHQVLVQRISQNNPNYIDSIPQLAGKTIYLVKGSSIAKHLQLISETLKNPIHIVEVDSLLSDVLINQVANGEINFTVATKNVAMANMHYYENIDASLRLSEKEEFTWAVRKTDTILAKELNMWLKKFKKTRHYAYINYRYFISPKTMHIANRQYFTLRSGKISKYDNLFKQKAKIIKWDWRLLAALSYQESHFNNDVKSRAGAFGLMQLMPTTAQKYGVTKTSSAQENITAGVRFLSMLKRQLLPTMKDTTDLVPFILAAYNVGLGHLQDARRLTQKYGANPDKWENNVAYYLLQKSRADFYNDPLVKYGYCRGEEPYLYVSEILERYKHYKNITNKRQQ